GAGDGAQRGGGLRSGRDHGGGDRLDRGAPRPAPRALLPWHRLRLTRARPVHPRGPRDARTRRSRGTGGRPQRAGCALHSGSVRPHQLHRAGAVRGESGRAGQQPERRPGVGRVPDPLRAAWPRHCSHRPARRPVSRCVGRGATGDRTPVRPVGRKRLIVGGMLTQATAIGAVAALTGFGAWVVATMALGVGTAMVYPTLLAAIGDVANPNWRASAVGVYRLWRDSGFAVGALVAGIIADAAGLGAAIWTVAALTAASGVVVALRMYETHPPRPRLAGATTSSSR